MRTAQEVDRLIARKGEIEGQLSRADDDQRGTLEAELSEINTALTDERETSTGADNAGQDASTTQPPHAVSAMGADQATARTTGAAVPPETPAGELTGEQLRAQQDEQRQKQLENEQAQAGRQPDPATQVRDSVTGAPLKQQE